MQRSVRAIVFCFLLVALGLSPVSAFGKNQVNVKQFRWKLKQTAHFDLYYDKDSSALVPKAEKYLEKAYESVGKQLNYDVPGRTPFFLYANHNEFEQTNIVDVGEGTGGVTEAFKNRFLIFNDGSERWLEHVITHEFTHVVEFNILNNGFWKSARLLKFIFYPLWMMEGLAEYTTGNVDETTEEMYLRDAAISGRLFPLLHLQNFAHLKPNQIVQAYKQGEAALEFLAEEYGPEKVPELLKAFRNQFDAHSVLQNLIGLDLFSFDRKYREYLEEHYKETSQGMMEPSVYGRRLTETPDTIPRFHTNPAFSPDGSTVAYLSNWAGYPQVFLLDLKTRKTKAAAGKQFRKIEYISTKGQGLDWSSDGKSLVFVGEKKQREYLYLYNVPRQKLRRIKIKGLEAFSSPHFSPDGQSVVVAGLDKGFHDLYLYHLRSKTLTRLTQDERDESSPVFSPDGRSIVFSGEENIESGNRTIHYRHLYQLNLEGKAVTPLTNLPGIAESPSFSPDGTRIIFTSDVEGVNDLYELELFDRAVTRLTKVLGGNFHPHYSPDGKQILFSSFRRGEMHVYLGNTEQFLREPVENKLPETTVSDSSSPPSTAWAEKDYHWKASTDLFFPALFYSSTDGLFITGFWQASELLGNHQTQTLGTYSSGSDFLSYRFSYAYRRWRPQWIFGVRGDNFKDEDDSTVKKRENSQWTGVQYSLDRFNRLELLTVTKETISRFTTENNRRERERENAYVVSFIRDTSAGQYLVTTRGHRFQLSHEQAVQELGGDRRLRNFLMDYQQFLPLPRRSTWAWRLFTLHSDGPDKEKFRLGGIDRVRGLSRSTSNGGAHVAAANVEYRFPIASDLNYYMWYLFPDFFFKNIYGAVFTDTGYAWDRRTDRLTWTDVENSVGIGVRIHVFILQLIPLELSFDWAKRTTIDRSIFYFSLGPQF